MVFLTPVAGRVSARCLQRVQVVTKSQVSTMYPKWCKAIYERKPCTQSYILYIYNNIVSISQRMSQLSGTPSIHIYCVVSISMYIYYIYIPQNWPWMIYPEPRPAGPPTSGKLNTWIDGEGPPSELRKCERRAPGKPIRLRESHEPLLTPKWLSLLTPWYTWINIVIAGLPLTKARKTLIPRFSTSLWPTRSKCWIWLRYITNVVYIHTFTYVACPLACPGLCTSWAKHESSLWYSLKASWGLKAPTWSS